MTLYLVAAAPPMFLCGWILAWTLLFRPRESGACRQEPYCAYCGWGLTRTGGYEVYRWEGEAYCSLCCLRRDAALRERERELEKP